MQALELDRFVHALAAAFVGGPWTRAEIHRRGAIALDATPEWLAALVFRVVQRHPRATFEDEVSVRETLSHDLRLKADLKQSKLPPPVQRWWVAEPTMRVTGPPDDFDVPPILTLGELARCLRLHLGELEWFADLRGMNARTRERRLQHYRYEWIAKPSGGHRLLEAPKLRLKVLQRGVLRRVLRAIPMSDIAHGFVVGRDVRSFVEPHCGREVVVALDLHDFFASVSQARVAAIFRRVGYPVAVAHTLAGLCTTRTPESVLERNPDRPNTVAAHFERDQRLRTPHLPQGAPSSPALANLAAWRMDRRLAGLAEAYGASVTRYADDLAFSGDRRFVSRLPRFLETVRRIVMDSGFSLHPKKLRVMRRSGRQILCGVVVNERPTIERSEVDRLRATLHNAVHHGPTSQNRDGHPDFRRHLEGRVAWVKAVHPAKAERLEALLARISW